MTLTTARLRLRPWQDGDRAPFAALNADPQVMRYFPAHLSRQESDALLERCQTGIRERGWGFWALALRESGAFVGLLGLQPVSANLPFAPAVEIGWRLAPPFWGKGLASEGARAALAFGFEALHLTEIVAFTTRVNDRSLAVMGRLGMTHKGTFEHPGLAAGHPLRPHQLFCLARGAQRIPPPND